MTDIVAAIRRLKVEKGAVILAHNYQVPEVYEVADFVGDSLELARQAQSAGAGLIVFCGVRFMAETAKIVNPGARVVLANPEAGCQMADMISADALRLRKSELGAVTTMAYVNTPADVKAESDICCTSANSVRVADSLPRDASILFVPDKHLAAWTARGTGRKIVAWEGFCYVHASFRAADVERARREHPQAKIIVHPECPLEVIDAADHVASTSGMVRLAAGLDEVVLGTEAGMCDRLAREFPGKKCWPLRRSAICRNMKLTGLKDVLSALHGEVAEVTLPPDVADRARVALDRMLTIH